MKKSLTIRNMDLIFLIIIASFAFDIGNLKYIFTVIFILFITISIISRGGFKKNMVFIEQFKFIFSGITVLMVITIYLQMKNGFNSYAINEFLYLLIPLLFVLMYAQYNSTEKLANVLEKAFGVYILKFLVEFGSTLTISNIFSISFVNSYSPFESELAFIFLIFEIFFLYEKKQKNALISLILCILSFKRFSTIVAIVFFIFNKWCSRDKVVKKRYAIILTIVFVLIPVFTCLFLNDSVENWCYRQFGISLSELTLSRSDRIEMAIESDEIKYGLGSTTTYMTRVLNEMHGSNFSQRNMHNVLVQIYLECGIIGSIAITGAYFFAARKNRISFLLMCYIFFENYMNHLLGAGCTDIWILVYMLMIITNNNIKENILPSRLKKRKKIRLR